MLLVDQDYCALDTGVILQYINRFSKGRRMFILKPVNQRRRESWVETLSFVVSMFFHIALPGRDQQKHLFCFDVFKYICSL